MNGRIENLSKTSQTVKNLLWRWIRHAEGVAPMPLTKYEDGMVVVQPCSGVQTQLINK